MSSASTCCEQISIVFPFSLRKQHCFSGVVSRPSFPLCFQPPETNHHSSDTAEILQTLPVAESWPLCTSGLFCFTLLGSQPVVTHRDDHASLWSWVDFRDMYAPRFLYPLFCQDISDASTSWRCTLHFWDLSQMLILDPLDQHPGVGFLDHGNAWRSLHTDFIVGIILHSHRCWNGLPLSLLSCQHLLFFDFLLTDISLPHN